MSQKSSFKGRTVNIYGFLVAQLPYPFLTATYFLLATPSSTPGVVLVTIVWAPTFVFRSREGPQTLSPPLAVRGSEITT